MVKLAAFLEASGCFADGHSRAWTGKFLLSGAMRAPPYTHPRSCDSEILPIQQARTSKAQTGAFRSCESAQQQGVDGKADGLRLFPALRSQSSHG